MSQPAAVAAAFDNAIRQVDRAMREGMRTSADVDAMPALQRLHADLVARRDDAVARGIVDAAWIGATVRAVAAWAPESDLTIIGALGGLAKLR
jgi:hypothetical protein